MVLFQIAGYRRGEPILSSRPDLYSFGIFKTKEEAIESINSICKSPLKKGYGWAENYCSHGANGYCVWINQIEDIGVVTKNTLRPGGKN